MTSTRDDIDKECQELKQENHDALFILIPSANYAWRNLLILENTWLLQYM